MSGFIALHREAFSHPMLKDADRFRAWFWLVANAAWKPTTTRIKGQTVQLERGELSFSQRFLAEKWDMSKSRVDRFIADLRAEGMITTRSKNGADGGHKAGQGQSIITICNYEKYQRIEDEARGNSGATGGATGGATAGQQRGKEEEGNKGTSNTPPTPSRRKPKWDQIGKPDDVGQQVWDDFIDLREAKRAPVTQTVINATRNEATKAGWKLEQALIECVASGWQGFKARYVDNRPTGTQRAPPADQSNFFEFKRRQRAEQHQ